MEQAAKRVPGKFGKLAGGAACAACCTAPMLVVTGVVSVSSLAVGGVTVALVATVVLMGVLVASRRMPEGGARLHLALFAAGGAGAFAGLWGAAQQRPRSSLVISAAVATLTAAALLALARAHGRVIERPAVPRRR